MRVTLIVPVLLSVLALGIMQGTVVERLALAIGGSALLIGVNYLIAVRGVRAFVTEQLRQSSIIAPDGRTSLNASGRAVDATDDSGHMQSKRRGHDEDAGHRPSG